MKKSENSMNEYRNKTNEELTKMTETNNSLLSEIKRLKSTNESNTVKSNDLPFKVEQFSSIIQQKTIIINELTRLVVVLDFFLRIFKFAFSIP
ncbi:hypothetical protein HZS_1967 [Henneguya salminicola]|nr:hypothetical protein HZS_1967 [Henneguya salminicola]